MSGFEVTPLDLQATAGELDQVGAEVRGELKRLDRRMAALLDGAWRGPASTAFERGWTQWRAGAADVLDALDALARLLASGGHGYERTDSTAAVALRGPQQ